jgi:ribonucleoside-triphosphate reductase
MPIFPNIIFKVKEGINWFPTDPNYDLLMQAIAVASVRMNPTFALLDSSFNAPYGLECSHMGCRTKLLANRHGKTGTVGRGNIAFVGINMPRIAIEAQGDVKKFYKELNTKLKLCEEQLMHRYNILKELKVKDIPFIFGQGIYNGSENLKYEDCIEPALKNGSLSIGWIGLAESLVALTSKHHGESEEAQKLGLNIIAFMRKFTDEASERNDLNFSLLASPAEGLAGRFTEMDKKIYGEIPGVTDKDYYSNSFHIPPWYKIDAHKKIELEGPYHSLTNAGHISYIEMAEAPIGNIKGVYELLAHMKASDMGYVGINFNLDFCKSCGKSGYFPEACTFCGKEDINRIRRITGYFSNVDNFNAGKLAELKDRVVHTSVPVCLK